MSSQLDIIQKTHNRGEKDFRFWLFNQSLGTLEIEYAPDGWDKNEVEYVRDKTYHGVFRNISVKELIFYKDGRNFIQTVYEQQGIDAEITINIQRLNPYLWTYEQYHTAKIDLTTYKIDEVSISVSLVDSTFNEKVKGRDGIEVNLNKEVSIDGVQMPEFENQKILFPDTNIERLSNYLGLATPIVSYSPHVVPMILQATDFVESQTPGTEPQDVGQKSGAFFLESQAERVLTLNVNIECSFLNLAGTIDVEFVVLDLQGVEIYRQVVDSQTGVLISISKTFQYTVEIGHSLLLEAKISLNGRFNYDNVDVECNEIYEGTPEKTVYSLGLYEALLRNSQLITDKEDSFYSDFFGRTDTPIIQYNQDGQLGNLIRGIYMRIPSVQIEDYPMATTFKKLFQTLDSVWCLGMAVEEGRVRVEKREHFYNDHVIIDLSDRLRAQDIGKIVNPELYYNDLNFGYNKSEYDQVYGLYEYNTKSVWSTPSLSKNKLTSVAQYRADNQGIRLLLKASEDEEYEYSKDYKGDEANFIIDAVRTLADGFVARTEEGFEYVGGTVYADRSFNLMLTPARSLRRWGSVLKAGLMYMLNQYLRWQTNDKNTKLFSKVAAEPTAIRENADILINDLDDPRWVNEIYENIEAPLTTAEKLKLDENPHGIIKLSNEYSFYQNGVKKTVPAKFGWIQDVKTGNDDNMSTFNLLRVNLNFVTPIESEPFERITEDDNARVTESEDIRVTE